MAKKVYPILRYTLARPFFSRPDEFVGLDNIPTQGPFIVASNHISYLDHFLIAAQIVKKTNQKIHFLATPEYWQWPMAKQLADYSGAIIIDKKDKKRCLDPAVVLLKEGGIIGIFPEAHRNSDKDLLRGKTGVARLALWGQVPVLPVGYNGSSTNSFSELLKHLYLKTEPIKITFGQPLSFSEYYDQEVDKKLLRQVTDEIMRAISQLCNKHYPYN